MSSTKRKVSSTKTDIQEKLLALIGAAGVISLALCAPNALQILGSLNSKSWRYKSNKYVVGVIGKLQKKGYIYFEKQEGSTFLRITDKGKLHLLKCSQAKKVLKKRVWDGKWRLVIFDIKEKKRYTRALIRDSLIAFGFVKLQNSVWVYPYDCEELITLLKADVHIGKEVLYIISEKIENDTWLRQKFKLL